MKKIIKEFISTKQEVENSQAYKDFCSEHTNYYLANAFMQLDAKMKTVKAWQFSYFNKEKDHLAVFETQPQISFHSFQDALKKEGSIPAIQKDPQLNITDIFNKLNEVLEEKHKHQVPKNYLVILQANEAGETFYNITVVTLNFSMLTFHINADSAEIMHEATQSIMDLGEQIKGDLK